jgi:hypothetical protein
MDAGRFQKGKFKSKDTIKSKKTGILFSGEEAL